VNTAARCDDCGWRGFMRTGWVAVEQAICSALPADRIRKRGSIWYYRRRLRELACPQCGTANLHAGRRVESKIGDPRVAMGQHRVTR